MAKNARELHELLGTTWRHRLTSEVAVVWDVTDCEINLIDVDWVPAGTWIVDLGPLNETPRYWVVCSTDELRRHWEQVKPGWNPIEP